MGNKRLFALMVVFAVFLVNVVGAGINYALGGGASSNILISDDVGWYNNPNNINDGDLSTYLGFSGSDSTDVEGAFEGIVNFNGSTNLNLIKFKTYTAIEYGFSVLYNTNIYLEIDGSWQSIYSNTSSRFINGEVNGSWSGVTAIKGYVRARDGTAPGGPKGATGRLYELEAWGPECECTSGECCDGCNFRPNTYECGPSVGNCDILEYCIGGSSDCPADQVRPTTYECRAAAGNCDIAEYCDGSNVNCPTDTLLGVGTECRSAAGPCDIAEICTGTSADCSADKLQPTTYECRAVAGNCDIAEYCDGLSTTCSANTFVAAGTSCGACMECDGFGNCNVIGNYNYRRGEIIDINDYACCGFDTDCVYNSVCYNEGASYSLDGKTRYCTNGMWEPVLELKCDWDNVICGYCGDIQCMNPQGQCVVDGTIIKDHFCDNGKWASRTSLVALQLLDIANRTSPDNYTLFCDNFRDTLNYLDYFVDGIWVRRYLSGWIDDFTKICGTYEEDCVDNVCVLKLPEQVIFGASLKKPINEAPLPFIKTLTGMGFCSDAIDINDGQFHQCSGSYKVWYNNKTMGVIYSDKDITDMPALTFWDKFLLFLKNPFQKIFDFLFTLFKKEVPKPKDYEFINVTTKFSRIYLDRKDVKAIKGITEKVEGLKGGEYVSVTYECYSEDICKSVNTSYKKIGGGGSLAFCRSEPLLGRYYVASNSSVALDLWPELTARLRTSAVKIPDTSVYPTIKAPTKAIVGYPIRFEADVEGCNLPFIYNWDFGDGQTCPPPTGCGLGDSKSPTHTYWTQGTKTVTLTVRDTDEDGSHESNSDTITIDVVSLMDCQIKAKSVGCDSDQRCIMSLSNVNDAHATADCGNNDFGYKLCCPNVFELDSAGCETGLVKVSGNAVDAHADAYYEGGSFMNNVCLKSAVLGMGATCRYSESGCNSASNEVCVVSLSTNADAHLSDCSDNNFRGKICCKII